MKAGRRAAAAVRAAVLSSLMTSVACAGPRDRGAPSSSASTAASAPTAAVSSATVSSSAPARSSAPATSASSAIDATSGASASYASGTDVSASGEIDVGALRKAHRDRIAKDGSPVTIVRGDTALALGEKICDAVVPKRPPETPILLKPNICGFDAMRDASSNGGDDGVRGRTTDPEFVRGVIQCLKKQGYKRIIVAEGCSLNHQGFQKLVTMSGYLAMTQAEQVPLVAMDDDGTYDVEGETPGKPVRVKGIDDTPVPNLLLPKVLVEHLEHGLFISLPKVKVHRYSVVSLSVKGMQGIVMTRDASPAHQQRWRMHKELNAYLKTGKSQVPDDRAGYVASLEAFSERMAAVLEIAAPDVVLADGAPAEGGNGFGKLVPYAEKFALGGTNPIAVDKVGAQLLGLYDSDKLALGLRGHKTSPLIEAAAKRFGLDLGRVQVTGDGASLLDGPRPVHFEAIAPFSIDFVPPKPR